MSVRSVQWLDAGMTLIDGTTRAKVALLGLADAPLNSIFDSAMRRVVVTGIGAVTPLGVGFRRTWTRLLAGDTGIVSTDPLGPAFQALPSRVAGLVPQGATADGAWDAADWTQRGDDRKLPLFTRYALAASHEALTAARLPQHADPDEAAATGVVLGSGIGSLDDAYDVSLAHARRGHHGVPPLFVPRLLLNLAAGHVAMRHGLRGPNLCPTTACTTGAHALSTAYLHLSHPRAQTHTFLAGAAEACIHPLALSGFARARALATGSNHDPGGAARPFDVRRAGFVIAEGACVLVLEELEHARARDAPILAEMVGFGESCDAHHVTAPPADGRGAVAAMRDALHMAGLDPAQVDYVNAHATGTALGDAAENHALRRVLLQDVRGHTRGADVSVSSTKGATGHLLGAAGALEAAFAIEAVRAGLLPPTRNLVTAGDASGASAFEESEAGAGVWDLNYVPGVAQERDVRVALTNSFGFGGTNACLAFQRLEG